MVDRALFTCPHVVSRRGTLATRDKDLRRVGLTWSLGRALQPDAVVFRDRLQQRTSDLKGYGQIPRL